MTAAEAARDAETAEALGKTVTGRVWVAGGLRGGDLSTLDATTRPIDALRAARLAPLIGHVRPLQDVVDRMAGKAAAVRSFTDTWKRVATGAGEVRQQLERTARDETAEWTGATADKYRARAGVLVEALRGTVALSTAMADAATAMGETVAAARGNTHRQLEELVGHLIDYVTRASAAEGGFTANVMAQATKLIDSYAQPIADQERALRQTVDTFEAQVSANGLAPQWTKIRDWFKVKTDAATTPAGGPTPPGQDERNWLGRGGAYLDGDRIIIRPRDSAVPSVTIPNNTGAQGFEVGPGYKSRPVP